MTSESYLSLKKYLEDIPVISSHEHHLPDKLQKDLTLDRILRYSYVGWYTGRRNNSTSGPKYLEKYFLPSDEPDLDSEELRRQRELFLDLYGYKSYWVWLEKGIQKIYGIDSISPGNWDEVSDQVNQRHNDSLAHIGILKETGGYLRAVQDSYWDYSSDIGHPELFSPTMRTDMFISSSHPTLVDHDNNSPFISYPEAPTDNFDDYLDFVEQLFTRWRNNGAVAMKCGDAYGRPIRFKQVTRNEARKVFYRPKNQVSHDDLIAYGDFMFHWFCELNKKLDIPFQIHTGLAKLSGSNPMLFEPILSQYPEIRFVLFHMGYPWYSEIAGLAHNYKNIIIDMVWGPIISTSASIQALHEYIEIATCDTLCWGGDMWTSEGAIGALLAWKFVVAKVLSEKIESGYINMKKAESLAKKLMYKNNAELYGMKNYLTVAR